MSLSRFKGINIKEVVFQLSWKCNRQDGTDADMMTKNEQEKLA